MLKSIPYTYIVYNPHTSIANLMNEMQAKPRWSHPYLDEPHQTHADGSESFQLDRLILISLSMRAITSAGHTYQRMMQISTTYLRSTNL